MAVTLCYFAISKTYISQTIPNREPEGTVWAGTVPVDEGKQRPIGVAGIENILKIINAGHTLCPALVNSYVASYIRLWTGRSNVEENFRRHQIPYRSGAIRSSVTLPVPEPTATLTLT